MPYLLMKIKLDAINFHERVKWGEKLFPWWFLINFLHSVSLYTHLITKFLLQYIFPFVECVQIYILSFFFNSQIYFKQKKNLFFSFIDFLRSPWISFSCFRGILFMAEYMLYLSHNTISYHFDITQMLISSALYFWWL